MSEQRRWTADELAAELYRRQGYLLIASHEMLPVGRIVMRVVGAAPGGCKNAALSTPLIVRGAATRDEFIRQDLLAAELAGDGVFQQPTERYFYRVEAAD